MSNQKIRQGVTPSKDGLPYQAYAIVGDPRDPATWKLPHHTVAIWRELRSNQSVEPSVDWHRMPAAVASLSPGGYRGRRVEASAGEKKAAAHHLAAHYLHAGREVPETLKELTKE